MKFPAYAGRGPTLNVNRDPRWGRNDEAPSEDPFYVGLYGAAWVQGVQQLDNPFGDGYVKVIASPKHFTGVDPSPPNPFPPPTHIRMS